MSDDLISRKALLDKLKLFDDKEHGNECFFFGLETAKEIIENEPTVFCKEKVVEEIRNVPHGYYNAETEDEIVEIVEKGGIK